jgi:FkbM family methyltransferase
MLSLLKDSLRPWYRVLFSKNYRAYYKLFSRYATYPRYSKTDISFLGYSVTVPDAVSFAYQFKEIFVEESYAFKTTSHEPLIYDCGANIGLSCLYFKKLFPACRIVAFEADPAIFDFLKSNLERNGVDSQNVQLFNKAVWITNEGVTFNAEGSDGGSIVEVVSKKKVEVASQRLRDLLKGEKIDLLKIDIEGAETDVLLDCDGHLNNVQNLFFEYHSFCKKQQRLNELLEMLTRNNFRYYIQSAYHVNSPFLRSLENQNMDMQLNIFCHKS